jgi:signal transduction histidine kinase
MRQIFLFDSDTRVTDFHLRRRLTIGPAGDADLASIRCVFQSILQNDTKYAIDLIENLLTLARADAGAVGLEFRKIDLVPRLQRAVEETAVLAACKNIRISSTTSSSPLLVSADGDALVRGIRRELPDSLYRRLDAFKHPI